MLRNSVLCLVSPEEAMEVQAINILYCHSNFVFKEYDEDEFKGNGRDVYLGIRSEDVNERWQTALDFDEDDDDGEENWTEEGLRIRWLPSHYGKCPKPYVYIDHDAAKKAYDSMSPFMQRCHDGLVSDDEIKAHALVLLEEALAEHGHLKRHKMTHTWERPFACDEPGSGYAATTSGALKSHKLPHSGERPFACDEPGCGYAARTSGALKRHKFTHTGERPFACDELGCGYASATSGALKIHKLKHTGERPFACVEPGCGYATANTGNLKSHKLTHSGERPFACDESCCR